MLAVILFILNIFAEQLLWSRIFWKNSSRYSILTLIILIITSSYLVVDYFTVWTVLLTLISLYRLVNILRIIKGRVNPDYLFKVTRISSITLILLQLVITSIWKISNYFRMSTNFWLTTLSTLSFIIAILLYYSCLINLKKYNITDTSPFLVDKDMPTLTVAIPARNETDDLRECLESLLQSDYPKLEILVLDDCSQEKRTSQIIRQFAHDGVIFIAGKPPPNNWLAKNFAYEQLKSEANGDIILFCGVDTRFGKTTIRRMVEIMIKHKCTMVSYMPKNITPKVFSLTSLMVQPSRYAWEVALPRRILNRPPILSTCWLVYSNALDKVGGFKNNSHSVSVESYFAKIFNKSNGYKFYKSSSELSFMSVKDAIEQRSTAIRMRYPQTHRRLEIVFLLSLIELYVLISPLIFLIYFVISKNWLLAIFSFINAIFLILFYAQIVKTTYQKFLINSLVLFPLASIYDVILLNYSMWLYEFRRVYWKGRNICLPIMHISNTLNK